MACTCPLSSRRAAGDRDARSYKQRPVVGFFSTPGMHRQVPSGWQLPCKLEIEGSSLHVWSAPGSHTAASWPLLESASGAVAGSVESAQAIKRRKASQLVRVMPRF